MEFESRLGRCFDSIQRRRSRNSHEVNKKWESRHLSFFRIQECVLCYDISTTLFSSLLHFTAASLSIRLDENDAIFTFLELYIIQKTATVRLTIWIRDFLVKYALYTRRRTRHSTCWSYSHFTTRFYFYHQLQMVEYSSRHRNFPLKIFPELFLSFKLVCQGILPEFAELQDFWNLKLIYQGTLLSGEWVSLFENLWKTTRPTSTMVHFKMRNEEKNANKWEKNEKLSARDQQMKISTQKISTLCCSCWNIVENRIKIASQMTAGRMSESKL